MELDYDDATNTLRLTPASVGPVMPESIAQFDGILDVGEGGRLIGVEFLAGEDSLRLWRLDPTSRQRITLDGSGRAYIQITAGDGTTTRSTAIRLTAEFNAHYELLALAIPRRGDGYEITYPSGNQ